MPDDTDFVTTGDELLQEPPVDDAALIARVATSLVRVAHSGRSKGEVGQRRWINRLLQQPQGLALMQTLTDEVLRVHDHRQAARRFRYLVGNESDLRFFGPIDRTMLSVEGVLADG